MRWLVSPPHLAILAFAFAALFLSGGQSARATQSGPVLDIETQHTSLRVNADSQLLTFADRHTGTNHAVNAPLARVQIGDSWHASTALAKEGANFRLFFGDTGASILLDVSNTPEYFVFRVRDVTGGDVKAVRYLDLQLDITESLDGPFVAAAMALDLLTKIDRHPMPVRAIQATCFPHLGVEGAATAIVACPTDRLREVMKKVVTEHPQVPHSRLGGPFALDAPETRGSYLMDTTASISVESVDRWIAMARAIGIDQLDWHCGVSLRFGDLEPTPESFPKGRESVKATVDQLHAAGMTAGLHTYAFFLDKKSRWVSPVPDKRLAKQATFTLAEDIDATATTVRVVESTSDVSTITGFFERNSVTLHVGDELIVFQDVVSEDGNAFVKCTRGANGTTPAPHRRGEPAHQLKECFGLFVPDAHTTLFDEVIQTTADVYNECGFDMIYLDAIDGSDILGGWADAWHYGGRFVWELHKRLKRPAIMEMSMFTHHMWYVRSRAGAWDRPTRGAKYMLDMHILANRHYDQMFLPKHLGWWGINNWSGFFAERMFTDDVEYLCGKCIAYDSSQSQLAGFDINTFEQDYHAQRMARIIRQYEELRLANRVSPAVREQVAVLGDEFTLRTDGGRPVFQRVHYGKHKVQRLEPWSSAWTASNPYDEQPAKIRVEALMSLQPYDHADSVIVSDFRSPDEFAEPASAGRVKFEIASVQQPALDATLSAALVAETDRTPRDDTWCRRTKRFSQDLNMNDRGFGVWVHGDGKGEIINLQTRCAEHVSHAYNDHYIKVDFEGWRYFELIEYESYEIPKYNWPYCPRRTDWENTLNMMAYTYPTYFYPLPRDKITSLSLYLNHLPADERVACYLSPIQALPIVNVTLKNPTVTINGARITFPVELPTGSYLEMYSADDCKVYDERGALVAEVNPVGDVPVLRAGANEVRFDCEGPEQVSARANVTVISYGDTLGQD